MQRPDETEPKDLGSGSPESEQNTAENSTGNTAESTHLDMSENSHAQGVSGDSSEPQEPSESDLSESVPPDATAAQSSSGEKATEADTDTQDVSDIQGASDALNDTDAQATELSDGDAELSDGDTELSEGESSPEEADATESLEKQLAERTEDLQRLSAEYANYRKRTERERTQIKEYAENGVVLRLLPILDDLDLAQQHGDMEGPLKAVADKLNTVMRELNVSAFGAAGDQFNPELHEAVQDTSTGDEKALGVVLRKGYQAGERVLRTAMVIVGDPTEDSDAGQS